MSKFPMPVGNIRFFEGDILKLIHSQTFKGKGEKKPFGFFEVEITTPNNLKIPILLTRITKNGQTSTVAPLSN